MPASLLTLAGIVVLFGPFVADADQLAELPGDVIAALAYVANWRFIVADQSYADLFTAPSPVQHFWSLAIEEQYYLFFPLLMAGPAGRRAGAPAGCWSSLAGRPDRGLHAADDRPLHARAPTPPACTTAPTPGPPSCCIGALLAVLLAARPRPARPHPAAGR